MLTNSVTAYTTGINAFLGDTSASVEKKEDPLGRDAFLTMLVAQLKNQDPLNPMQGSDFSAQLAQFSSLEQLFNVNDNLKSIKESSNQDSGGNLLDYIGKEVLSKNDTLSLKDGKTVGAYYHLDQPASIIVNITDSNGTQVAQLKLGQQDAGAHEVTWDGVGLSGDKSPDGDYQYEVLSVGQDGVNTLADTGISGKISGVTFDQGTPYLLMGDRRIAPSTVVKVYESTAADS